MRDPLGFGKLIAALLAGPLAMALAVGTGLAATDRYAIDISLQPDFTTEIRVVGPPGWKPDGLRVVLTRKGGGAQHEFPLRGGAMLSAGCRSTSGSSAALLRALAPLDEMSYNLVGSGAAPLATIRRELGTEAVRSLMEGGLGRFVLRSGTPAPGTPAMSSADRPPSSEVQLDQEQPLRVTMTGSAASAGKALLLLSTADRWTYSEVLPIVGGIVSTYTALPAGVYRATTVADRPCAG